MSSPFDNFLGVHAAALPLHQKRLDQIATNIANADTPGYLARDLDFSNVLKTVVGQNTAVNMVKTNTQHLGISSSDTPTRVYRLPLQPSEDGNTVDTAIENATFSETAIRYQASMTFIERKISGLLTAITGE